MGLTHLDAGVVIGFLDRNDAHHGPARAALDAARDRHDALEMAASAVAACLVGPARRGPDAVMVVREMLAHLPVGVVDLDEEIVVAAATLRAQHRSLRSPDALVIASAIARGAERLVTTDRGWPPAHSLGLAVDVLGR